MTREEAIKVLGELLDAFDRDEHGDFFYDHGWDVCEATILAQGALREPQFPCKPGDTVYRLCGQKGHKYVAARVVISVTLCGGGQSWGILTTAHDWLGKTVFLTREEAEDALQRLEDV